MKYIVEATFFVDASDEKGAELIVKQTLQHANFPHPITGCQVTWVQADEGQEVPERQVWTRGLHDFLGGAA